MKYLRYTDPVRWVITIIIIIHIFMDAGIWVGVFSVGVSIHIEFATITERLTQELRRLTSEILSALIGDKEV